MTCNFNVKQHTSYLTHNPQQQNCSKVQETESVESMVDV